MLQAQEQRFKAGLVLGVNAAQINGDFSAGFNKLGLQGGLRGITIFTEKTHVALELLYSQRGSQTELVPDNSVEQRKIHLDYVEVPVIFIYKDWLDEEKGFYKIEFNGGLSYSRLLNVKIEDVDFDPFGDLFNKNDFAFVLGAGFNLSEKWSLAFRYNRSMNLLFNPEKNNINSKALLGFFLNFRAQYTF